MTTDFKTGMKMECRICKFVTYIEKAFRSHIQNGHGLTVQEYWNIPIEQDDPQVPSKPSGNCGCGC